MAKGTKDDPWRLKTPTRTSDITLWREPDAEPPALVCIAGGTELRYHISAPEDLAAMLRAHGDWMELGTADEQKEKSPARSRRGRARPTTLKRAGTASKRACAAASAIT